MKIKITQVNKIKREVLSKGNNVNTDSKARDTIAVQCSRSTKGQEVRLQRREHLSSLIWHLGET